MAVDYSNNKKSSHADDARLVRHGVLASTFRTKPRRSARDACAIGVLISVAASLMLVKTVPQKPCSQPLEEIMVLIRAVAIHDRSV